MWVVAIELEVWVRWGVFKSWEKNRVEKKRGGGYELVTNNNNHNNLHFHSAKSRKTYLYNYVSIEVRYSHMISLFVQ